MFRVGQKVICVDDTGEHWDRAKWALPIKGQVYTVREICILQATFIRLEEFINGVGLHHTGEQFEPRFKIERFRPIVSRKTDISTFTEMLTPSDEKTGALT